MVHGHILGLSTVAVPHFLIVVFFASSLVRSCSFSICRD
ncbi:hypothetical protein AALP_AA6G111100 [Arabis alpina]|uniref:Transmembrane protein n=1 Tax=Arabis alpina TaxID=50452 RepID=A0A087GNH9_ARAAL|nr:hypothetical protein AALP_AA6G111100 [Arabis alpina]